MDWLYTVWTGITIDQVLLGVLGVAAIWLTQHEDPRYTRYACLLGLAGQPFWFYATFTAGQWGIFILCFFYAWSWFKGFRRHWWPLLKAKCYNRSNGV